MNAQHLPSQSDDIQPEQHILIEDYHGPLGSVPPSAPTDNKVVPGPNTNQEPRPTLQPFFATPLSTLGTILTCSTGTAIILISLKSVASTEALWSSKMMRGILNFVLPFDILGLIFCVLAIWLYRAVLFPRWRLYNNYIGMVIGGIGLISYLLGYLMGW